MEQYYNFFHFLKPHNESLSNIWNRPWEQIWNNHGTLEDDHPIGN
jgi:hypothetical protein